MSTTSSYRIIDETVYKNGKRSKKTICLFYVQSDGYPSGHPLLVVKKLSSYKLSFDPSILSVQLIKILDENKSTVYLYPTSKRGRLSENYLYDIMITNQYRLTISVYEKVVSNESLKYKLIFSGSPDRFINRFKQFKSGIWFGNE